MKCLLQFGPESFVLPFAVQKYKDYNTENYSFSI